MKLDKNTKANLTERGITLIALVVTIVVLIILAGIAINQITGNNGIIQRAIDSAEIYKNSENVEQSSTRSFKERIAEIYSKSKMPLPRQNLIGKYVDYTPDLGVYEKEKLSNDITGIPESYDYWQNSNDLRTENYTNGWRIFDYDEEQGKLLLVSASGTERINLSNVIGYTNAVNIFNDACKKLYGNAKLNANVRNMNFSDIESRITDVAKSRKGKYYNWENDYMEYSKIGDLYNEYKVPNFYGYELNNQLGDSEENPKGIQRFSNMEDAYESLDGSEGKQTFYWVNFQNSDDFIDDYKEHMDLIYGDSSDMSYWLATRRTAVAKNDEREYVSFFVSYMRSGQLGGVCIWNTYGSYSTTGLCIRPIVELNNIKLVTNGKSGDSKDAAWHIKKYN